MTRRKAFSLAQILGHAVELPQKGAGSVPAQCHLAVTKIALSRWGLLGKQMGFPRLTPMTVRSSYPQRSGETG